MKVSTPIETVINNYDPNKEIKRLHATPLSAKGHELAHKMFSHCGHSSAYKVVGIPSGVAVGVVSTCIALIEAVASLAYATLATLVHCMTLCKSMSIQDHVIKSWGFCRHSFLMTLTPFMLFAHSNKNELQNIQLRSHFYKINCAQAAQSLGSAFNFLACRKNEKEGLSTPKYNSIEVAIEGLTDLFNKEKIYPSNLSDFSQDEFVSFLKNSSKVRDDLFNDFFVRFRCESLKGKKLVKALTTAMATYNFAKKEENPTTGNKTTNDQNLQGQNDVKARMNEIDALLPKPDKNAPHIQDPNRTANPPANPAVNNGIPETPPQNSGLTAEQLQKQQDDARKRQEEADVSDLEKQFKDLEDRELWTQIQNAEAEQAQRARDEAQQRAADAARRAQGASPANNPANQGNSDAASRGQNDLAEHNRVMRENFQRQLQQMQQEAERRRQVAAAAAAAAAQQQNNAAASGGAQPPPAGAAQQQPPAGANAGVSATQAEPPVANDPDLDFDLPADKAGPIVGAAMRIPTNVDIQGSDDIILDDVNIIIFGEQLNKYKDANRYMTKYHIPPADPAVLAPAQVADNQKAKDAYKYYFETLATHIKNAVHIIMKNKICLDWLTGDPNKSIEKQRNELAGEIYSHYNPIYLLAQLLELKALSENIGFCPDNIMFKKLDDQKQEKHAKRQELLKEAVEAYNAMKNDKNNLKLLYRKIFNGSDIKNNDVSKVFRLISDLAARYQYNTGINTTIDEAAEEYE